MTKVAAPSIVVRPNSVEVARRALSELVMAWARDAESGEPRYIGEIDADHRGAKCGCVCPSCGLSLIAVNAAKDEFQRRPHFRHPEGTQRNDCAVLAARIAALRLLTEEGVINLPRRRMSVRIVGLSGVGHDAWAELPPEKVRVSQIDFKDRTFALLTLEDGRQLRVALTGGIGENVAGGECVLVPTITVDVEESLAGLDEAKIRQRLQLLPDAICWRSHWDDAGLRAEAEAKAREAAVDELDWPADDVDLPPDLSPELRRETLLHYEVTRILECARQIAVPSIEVVDELRTEGIPIQQRKSIKEASVLKLANTRLEKRMGHTVPDVVTEAYADGGESMNLLLVEVTVTNVIDDERTNRIRGLGVAALEIDLSRAGGRVTRSELHDLVVHDVVLKKWIAHPELERYARVMAEPLVDVANRYLVAAEDMFVNAEVVYSTGEELRAGTTKHVLAVCVEEMEWRGFPEAGNDELLRGRQILSRILSIKRDTGIGYQYRSGFEVLNAIRQSRAGNTSDWTLYLIAAKVYAPAMTRNQQVWFREWCERVRRAIREDDVSVMRDGAYDRILALLFPEMADALAKPFGNRSKVPNQPASKRPRSLERVDQQAIRREADFLRGAELEAWKKAHPESALAWESRLRKLRIS